MNHASGLGRTGTLMISAETSSSFFWTASPEDSGARLDSWLVSKMSGTSRAKIQSWMKAGFIALNGSFARPSHKIKAGDKIRVELQTQPAVNLRAEPIPLDILYEDDDILLLNKPPGLVVHPSAGHASGTLVNALLHHCPALAGPGARPGIVHRLDRDTSGVIVAAKTERALASLAAQFKERRVRKEYLALAWGAPKPSSGCITGAIGRSLSDRKKMAVRKTGGRAASTTYEVIESFSGVSLLKINIQTGRTHQIRVHLAHIGHPVVGDSAYGSRSCRALPIMPARQMLHAAALSFTHPATGEEVRVQAPIPNDMLMATKALRLGLHLKQPCDNK